MLLARTHCVNMDSCYQHVIMVNTWTLGIDNTHGINLQEGRVLTVCRIFSFIYQLLNTFLASSSFVQTILYRPFFNIELNQYLSCHSTQNSKQYWDIIYSNIIEIYLNYLNIRSSLYLTDSVSPGLFYKHLCH